MTSTSSWTRWRDPPLVPEAYDEVARLVQLARRARKRIVEFDWRFTEQELRALRAAVHDWGSGVVGRYKCFDARVLAAISEALGERDTEFHLAEPRNTPPIDCTVECVRDGVEFRLRGHASFDLVLGYGLGVLSPEPSRQRRLGTAVAATIYTAVRALGWDLDRLQDPRLAPAVRALYGLPLNYGEGEVLPAAGPAEDVRVHFRGPFAAVEGTNLPCLFTHDMARESGVYIWTVLVDGEDLPYYVGQTRRGFGQRTGEHLAAHLSGEYSAFDPVALAQGRYHVFWRAEATSGGWPGCLPLFLRDYEANAPRLLAMIRLLRFHVAPLAGDAHWLGRVEGAVGRHLKRHENDRVRTFFGAGIQLPAPVPNDKPLRILLTSDGEIAGLPSELRA